ncbi:MAG TPA: PQ-loop domain-containing transporter [Jatrophihabitans sp.]|nr:PQ-loop domain-containing transporter [Jatrophihabitans sp.]
MALHALAEASGYLGATLGVGMVIPQIMRTLRDRTMPGVSALSWALTALSCTSWLLYGLRTGELPQIPGNVLLVTGAVVIVLVVPSAVSAGVRAVRVLAAALAIAALVPIVAPAVIGVVALSIGLVSALPQAVRSLRHRAAGESAVSLLTWWLRVGSQASWLGYAIALHDTTVMLSAVVLLSTALVVLGSELVRRPAPVCPAPATA